MVELSAGEDIEMEVGVPEDYIARIQTGEPVRVRFSALSGLDFAAQVREIAYALDASSTYPVIVQLDAPSPSIRPGMAGEVEFRFGTGEPSEDPLVVPVKAVGEDANGQYVFVIDEVAEGLGTVHRRAIRVGKLLADGFIVKEGLADRELVATAGLRSLLNGMKCAFWQSEMPMNLTQMALENNRVTLVVLLVVALLGLIGYQTLPRDSMPPYTIRVASVVTSFPGAGPERVEALITSKIEEAAQELPELKTVSSESRTGLSVVSVELKQEVSPNELQAVWDRLRRKIETVRPDLPEDIRGPEVNDDGLGVVYGIVVGPDRGWFHLCRTRDLRQRPA